MSTELNSSEKIKRNMEIAMEWMTKLDYRISSVSVYDFGIYLIADEYSIEFSNKILETAEEIAENEQAKFRRKLRSELRNSFMTGVK